MSRKFYMFCSVGFISYGYVSLHAGKKDKLVFGSVGEGVNKIFMSSSKMRRCNWECKIQEGVSDRILGICMSTVLFRRHSNAHLSPQPLNGAPRLSPQHPLAAAGQPLYHQTELYRRPVYVTTTQPAYLPAAHQVAPTG